MKEQINTPTLTPTQTNSGVCELEQIEVITYEQDRLNYFADLMKKAQERYKRLFKKFKDAPYASEEAQALSDAGRETHFLGDVVGILEGKQREWISVEDRLPTKEDADKYEHVLAITRDGRVRDWWYELVIFSSKNFTHWMPLPQPPEMKGGVE